MYGYTVVDGHSKKPNANGNFANLNQVKNLIMSIKLTKVKCVKPATGIEREGIAFGNAFSGTLGTGAAVIGAGAGGIVLGTGGAGTPVAAIAGGIAAIAAGGAAVSGFVTWLAGEIDSNRSSDNLYIKINGQKKWPSGKKQDIKGGETISVDIDCPVFKYTPTPFLNVNNLQSGASYAMITLMEYDWGSKDDNLGTLVLPEDHRKGVFTYPVDNAKEDSAYLLELAVS